NRITRKIPLLGYKLSPFGQSAIDDPGPKRQNCMLGAGLGPFFLVTSPVDSFLNTAPGICLRDFSSRLCAYVPGTFRTLRYQHQNAAEPPTHSWFRLWSTPIIFPRPSRTRACARRR